MQDSWKKTQDCLLLSHLGPQPRLFKCSHLRGTRVPGKGAQDLIHHRWGWLGLEPLSSQQALVKKKAFSGKSSLRGSREEGVGEAQWVKPKDGWPEGHLGGRSGVSQDSLTSQHRSRPCKDHSCRITLQFLSVYQRSCVFSLLSLSTEYKWPGSWENSPALVLPHWHGGWEEAGGGKRTPTPTRGRVVLMGPGPGRWWVSEVLGPQAWRTTASSRHRSLNYFALSGVCFPVFTEHPGRLRPCHEAEQELPFTSLC